MDELTWLYHRREMGVGAEDSGNYNLESFLLEVEKRW